MPNIDPANGQGWLVICTGAGEATIALDGADGDHAAPADAAQPGLCPFALLAVAIPLLLLVALLLPVRRDRIPAWPPAPASHCRQSTCAPPGARAPPLPPYRGAG